ncbi:MAG TPA: cyclodeaminase/cyclohydrolase family protein [Vicinamibacterales bacterium]|nr:cyclodeaminase/cyclohydrolase family protein [Vicinamibacterales bacterium]
MPRFADLSIDAFLAALSSPDPTPGGGTAAAVAGAMGTSLLMMVCGLAKSRNNTDDERAQLSEARTALAAARDRLVQLADRDTEAFNQVMAAYRLPKSTDEETSSRKAAVQQALRGATDAPLETLRAARDATVQAHTVARYGNRSATSDVRVALELLEAAAAGATANVDINLTGLNDEAYRRAAAAEVFDLTNRVTEDVAAARSALKTADD